MGRHPTVLATPKIKYFFRRCLTGAPRNPIPPLHCSELDAHKYQKVTRTTHPQHATVSRIGVRNATFRAPCPQVPVQGPPKHSKQAKASIMGQGTLPWQLRIFFSILLAKSQPPSSTSLVIFGAQSLQAAKSDASNPPSSGNDPQETCQKQPIWPPLPTSAISMAAEA